MNDIVKFIEKPYSLRINSQLKSEDPSDKTWHRNIEKYGIESFSKKDFNAKKRRSQKTVLEGDAKYIFTK